MEFNANTEKQKQNLRNKIKEASLQQGLEIKPQSHASPIADCSTITPGLQIHHVNVKLARHFKTKTSSMPRKTHLINALPSYSSTVPAKCRNSRVNISRLVQSSAMEVCTIKPSSQSLAKRRLHRTKAEAQATTQLVIQDEQTENNRREWLYRM